ncbi:MAG: CBS domain-containing protein [Planctomycetota bacterium]
MTAGVKSAKPVAEGALPEHFVTDPQPWEEVQHIMTTDVATVSPDETVASAAAIMAGRNISCVIVAENKSVLGILTERDLLNRVVVPQGGRAAMRVAEVMSSPVEGIEPHLSTFDASLTMDARGLKHLPVLQDGRLVGIVTQTDLTEALGRYSADTTVAEIMSRDMATVECKAAVAEAAQIMSGRNISCIVAVEGGQVKGVLTERDLLKRIVASQQDSANTTVEQVMSSPVITIPTVNSVFSAARILQRMNIRRLVVTENDRLCGIVTQKDLFRAIRQEWQQEEEENLKFLEESEYAIYTTDLEGKATYVNPAFIKMLGLGHSGEMVGHPLLPERFWVNPQERARLIHELKEAGFIEGRELALKNSQGQRVYVALMSTFTKSSSGQVNGSQGVLRDITERKLAAEALAKAYEVLREQDRFKSEFISTVSHELRTPLGIFKNVVSNAIAGCFGTLPPDLQKTLDMADRNINRLAKLISDFLDISRIEAGEMKLHVVPVSIQSIAAEVIASLMPLAAGQNIELESFMPDSELLISADRDRMVQVLMNLVGNAIKFVPANGRVTVSATCREDEVRVEVADDGPGIEKKDIDRIFSRFVQVEKIIGPGEHGTGLGLPIAKGLVELHGGRIWVESTPAAGATFCFALPKYSEASQNQDQSKGILGPPLSVTSRQKSFE